MTATADPQAPYATPESTAPPLAGAAGEGEMADFSRAINGYAPGSYFGKCYNCKQEFMGDKRAVSCPKCAYNAAFEHLEAEAATLRTRLQEAEDAGAKWRGDLLDILHGWMETAAPAEHHYETAKGYQVDLAAHEEFFKCKALGYGLPWPLEDAYLPSLPTPGGPLLGDSGKEGPEVCQCGAVGYGFGACAWCEVAKANDGKEAASE